MEQRNTNMVVIACLVVLAILFVYKNSQNAKNEQQWQWDDSWGESDPQVDSSDVKEETASGPDGQTALTFQDAMAKGAQYNRPVFVFLTADWCGFCKKMKTETFSDVNVKKELDKVIVAYLDEKDNKDLIAKFEITGLPGMVMISPDGQSFRTHTGYMDVAAFTKWLGEPMQKGNTQRLVNGPLQNRRLINQTGRISNNINPKEPK